MNKRIQELYKQAYGYFPSPVGEPETEKFAELIVKECIEISRVGSITKDKIKQHFGVEE